MLRFPRIMRPNVLIYASYKVTVGRRNVPKGRVWNPMEVSSIVNYTQILFHVARGSPAKCPAMVGRGSPVGGKLHSNFVGLKFIINCFSLSHIIWWVFYLIGNHSVWKTSWLHRPKCCM